MKSVLIINKKQFGYHTDSYELAKYLSSRYNVAFFCFDTGRAKHKIANVEVIYISNTGNFVFKVIRFLRAAITEANKEYDFRFLTYFNGCAIVKLVSNKHFILDFRTGSVDPSNIKRQVNDGFKRLESKVFEKITVISSGLRDYLKIPTDKAYVLPLGANILSKKNKTFSSPKLFYIGTLFNRNVEETIKGVGIFIKNNSSLKGAISYDIVGTGRGNDLKKIRAVIEAFQLEDVVNLHGFKSHEDTQELFDNCNIGVAYIPMTTYFNHQPATKVYEYILSGMLCIATNTFENKKNIVPANGSLCDDNSKAFAKALETLVKNFSNYNSEAIRNSLINNEWNKIFEAFEKNCLLK